VNRRAIDGLAASQAACFGFGILDSPSASQSLLTKGELHVYWKLASKKKAL
jgi:hypothetical protein